MSIYQKLTDFLIASGTFPLKLTFSEIENVLGFELPPSARRYPAWWANDPSPGRHSDAWLSAGRETEELDLAGEKVTFRTADITRAAGEGPPDKSVRRKRPQNKAISIAGTLPLAETPPVRLALEMQWCHLGMLNLDADSGMVFPVVPGIPGLYRFRLNGKGNDRLYIGETVNLRRRFQHYRKPGPTQATNIRINHLLQDHLAAGGKVGIDVIVEGTDLEIDAESVRVDLADKTIRRFLEYAALVTSGGSEIESLNR